MGKKWLDYFLGGISRSARVIFFGRARLAHQRSGDRFVVAFRSCARDGYNRNEIAVNETGDTATGHRSTRSSTKRPPRRTRAASLTTRLRTVPAASKLCRR
jgi:hypothetical protein